MTHSDENAASRPTDDSAGLEALHRCREQYMRDLYGNATHAMSLAEFTAWWTGLADELKKVLEPKFRKGWKAELSEGAAEVHRALSRGR